MFSYSDVSIVLTRRYVPSGYVAGHLRFKFIREEAADTNSDDEGARSDDDGDDDDDDDQDGDGSKSKDGGMKGSKTQKSREVVTK
jgi:hypothetical protein